MNLNTGQAVVIAAVLIFYLRLILLQRQRIKQIRQAEAANQPKKNKQKQAIAPPRYSLLSPNRRDRVIGGVGVVLIILGVLYYAKVLPPAILQTYWWLPLALGIVAFSWLFRL